MTISALDTIASEEKKASADMPVDRMPVTALPKLVWVGGSLFIANLIIGFGMLITPSLQTDPYGREVQPYEASSSKMSPFTEVVDTTKRKVRLAAKAYPVTFVPAPEEEIASPYEAASLDLPRSSQLNLPRASSRELDLPRASRAYQQLDIPVRTERAVYQLNAQPGVTTSQPKYHDASADVAPRRASERAKSFVVIN